MKLVDKLPELIRDAHLNSQNKKFFPDNYWSDPWIKDQCLMLVVSELSEAVEALRTDRFANLQKFNNCITETAFYDCFTDYIKNSFEDECADVCIRLFTFIGAYEHHPDDPLKGIELENIRRGIIAELEQLGGVNNINLPAFLFQTVRSITDIKYAVFSEQYIGETIARMIFVMNYLNKDLLYFIQNKMQYNRSRPTKHNKQF